MKTDIIVYIAIFSLGAMTGYWATKDRDALAVNLANAANGLVVDCEKRTKKDCYLDAREEP